MDFQYHMCTIKQRLHALALGGVWPPSSTELAMKKELYGFLFLCMHVVVSIATGL